MHDWKMANPFANREVTLAIAMISSIPVIGHKPCKRFLVWEVLR
jgi:hypothetical protein